MNYAISKQPVKRGSGDAFVATSATAWIQTRNVIMWPEIALTQDVQNVV